MPAQQVRADYDQLKDISSMFNNEAQACQNTNRSLKSLIEQLKGGDWIGRGADQFYKEMESEVMPAMGKLQKAMDEAGRITREIAQVMRQAEEETSGWFKI
jgi:WXG100 family type VII secretion target